MRRVLGVLLCCGLLQFAGGSVAARRQKPAPPPAEGASLAETIAWLDSQLVRYGRMRYYYPFGPFEAKYSDTQFEYLRADGCVVRYRDSALSRGYERTADLAGLDPARVKVEVRKGLKGGMVVFTSAAGRQAVTTRGRGGREWSYHTGAFGVSDAGALEGIAEALRRAITMCRR